MKVCRCRPGEIQKYRGRVSGPLLDRIDIHVDVPPVEFRELSGERSGEPSAAARLLVESRSDQSVAQFHRFPLESTRCDRADQTRASASPARRAA